MILLMLAFFGLLNYSYGWFSYETAHSNDAEFVGLMILFLAGVIDIGVDKILEAIKEK